MGLIILLAALSGAAPAQCFRQSPQHSVALLELYTSEGCDSCPAADRWLSGIGPAHSPHSMIPLALHVDYWDRLGWKDRFAHARHGQRQRELTRLAEGKVVYTPGVLLNLREFRTWSAGGEFQKAVASINARPARADIQITLTPLADAKIELRARFTVRANAGAARPQAYIVIYENGLQTAVKAGENRGVTLRHDYVARQWMGPLEFRNGSAQLSMALSLQPEWLRAHLGVAAFVQDASDLGVLQATALGLCA